MSKPLESLGEREADLWGVREEGIAGGKETKAERRESEGQRWDRGTGVWGRQTDRQDDEGRWIREGRGKAQKEAELEKEGAREQRQGIPGGGGEGLQPQGFPTYACPARALRDKSHVCFLS